MKKSRARSSVRGLFSSVSMLHPEHVAKWGHLSVKDSPGASSAAAVPTPLAATGWAAAAVVRACRRRRVPTSARNPLSAPVSRSAAAAEDMLHYDTGEGCEGEGGRMS